MFSSIWVVRLMVVPLAVMLPTTRTIRDVGLRAGLPVWQAKVVNETQGEREEHASVTVLRSPILVELEEERPLVRDPTLSRLEEAVTLRVAVEEWVPHIGVREESPGNVIISGPMANLLQSLAHTLNFRYTLVRPPDGAWGIPTSGGDWSGMIGMEADLALGPFGLTYSRSRVVDFSSPILIDYYRILVQRPRAEPNPLGFLGPFRSSVWGGLVACVGVVGATLYCVSLAYHHLGNDAEKSGAGYHLLMSHLWTVYSALLGEPYTWVVQRGGERVVVVTWCMVSLIVARSYSSALTSLLAVRTVPAKYNSLKEVVEDNKLNLIFEKATALVEHMSTVQQGIYKDLADTRLTGRAHFLPASQLYSAAYNEVRNKRYALLVEDTTCRKVYSDDFTKYGRCDFYIGKEQYWPLIFGMIGRKGSQLMPKINAGIERLVSQDLYFKWLGDELPNATACLKATNRVTVNEAYRLIGLWGVFVVLVGGMLVAAGALLCELLMIRL
ncbi:glutamate receptor-like isoform X2 [Cherax quadricarinatus]|uniref:glutamate receptor-like isoform X2 n=1 Tax=Cherax quadricarinatus TaxID=27406 RepID=UPI002379545C|nr:glutamate receptor-like isoform X2 [Cherax quadricarinatus]